MTVVRNKKAALLFSTTLEAIGKGKYMDLFKKWELCLKTLTLFGAIGAGIWTFSSYIDTKEKEFYTEFWNEKMDLFQQTSNAAATMATTSDLGEFNKARSDYWKLFYGELSLVEGICVKKAMQLFSACVPTKNILNSSSLPMTNLKQPSYKLTIRLRDELAKSWEFPFSELDHTELPKRCNFEEEICLINQ